MTAADALLRRRGMTLVELLVVVAIIVIVFGAIVPQIRPAVEDLKLREGARMVNVFLAGQQAIALEQGRPAGVRFRPLIADISSDAAAQSSVRGVQELIALSSPSLYSGETTTSWCRVSQNSPSVSPLAEFALDHTTNPGTMSALAQRARAGDLIRFNGRGPWMVITTVSGAQLTFQLMRGTPLYPPVTSVGDARHTFQIARKPIPTSSTMQLPRGICVDMANSGRGAAGFALEAEAWQALDQIDLLFDGHGRPYFYFTRPTAATNFSHQEASNALNPNPHNLEVSLHPVPTAFFFHVGRVENLGAANLADQNTLWVSVSGISGQCRTFENLGGNLANARGLRGTGEGKTGQ